MIGFHRFVRTKISTISLTIKYILDFTCFLYFYTKLEIVLRTYIGYILNKWFKFTTKGQGESFINSSTSEGGMIKRDGETKLKDDNEQNKEVLNYNNV